jgi:hypothetical protein
MPSKTEPTLFDVLEKMPVVPASDTSAQQAEE